MTSLTKPSPEALTAAVQSKVIVITGSASGIGLASAKLLAEHKAQIVIVDLDATKCQAAAELIGNGAMWKACDVTSWLQQIELFEWVVSKFGSLDIMCCNAGIDPEMVTSLADGHPEREKTRGRVFYDFSTDEMEEGPDGKGPMLKAPSTAVLDVNIKGPLYGLKLAMHHMKKLGKGGRIIFTGSANSYLPLPSQLVYVSSKHAVLGMMRSAARRQDCANANISIALLVPWTTHTPLTAEVLKFIPEDQIETSTPEDLAWAMAYLCSIEPQRINGKAVWVQGKQLTEVEDEYYRLCFNISSKTRNSWIF